MSPKSLFLIILKVLGLFFAKDLLLAIPQLFTAIYYMTTSYTFNEGIWVLLTTLGMIVIYWFVAYYLIFKSELIINTLQLDKGFAQEDFPLNIHRSTVLSIAVIVIGGLLVVNEIPDFCREVYSYLQQKRLNPSSEKFSGVYPLLSAIKLGIGIFLIAGQRQIVNFIERKRKK